MWSAFPITEAVPMDPTVNRQYILKSRPVALPTAEEVPMIESPVPEAGEGEIVIRNLFISLDPAIRGWMSDEPNYIEPIPVGTKVWATGIGRVVQSNSPDFEVGDIALGMNAWEDYSLCDAAAANKIDNMGLPLTNFLGVLGPTGLTAYFGLLDVGHPKEGETVIRILTGDLRMDRLGGTQAAIDETDRGVVRELREQQGRGRVGWIAVQQREDAFAPGEPCLDLGRQRHLYDHAMYAFVAVQRRDQRQQLLLSAWTRLD